MLNKSKRKAQLIVITTFLLGAFTGGLTTYLVQNQQAKNEVIRTSVLDEIDRRVNLRPEQRVQVDALMQHARQQYKEIKEQTWPQYDSVRQSARGKVRNLLSPEQQGTFDQYMQELDAKRAANRRAEAAAK